MNIAVDTKELRDLQLVLQEYTRVVGKLPEEVISKKAKDFAFTAYAELRKLAPGKGSIRASLMARLKSHSSGINIRESVRRAIASKYNAVQLVGMKGAHIRKDGKTKAGISILGNLQRSITKSRGRGRGKKIMNLQALMAEREINVRESASGYLSVVALMRGIAGIIPGQRREFIGKAGQEMSSAEMTSWKVADTDGSEITLTLGSPGAQSAGEGMEKPRAQAALSQAVTVIIKDTREYLERKAVEAGQRLT